MRTLPFPDVWGPCQLFAFSGIDGATSWFEPLVLHTGEAPFSFTIKAPAHGTFAFELPGRPVFERVTGDAIDGHCGGERLTAVYADQHTVIGRRPAGAAMLVNGAMLGDRACVADGDGRQVWAADFGESWALVLTPAGQTPDWTAIRALDVEAALAARGAFLEQLPVPPRLSTGRARLLRKAVSVMKVNYEAPAGCISRLWSTPDRWPHRHMWLWDSAFHAVGMARVNPAVARNAVLAMLEQTRDDGFLPHTIRAGAEPSEITQPPILAWAALTVQQQAPDPDFAVACLPHLRGYLEWIRLNRDRNGNGVPEWFIEGVPLCRCGESGLDNSPVYDGAVLLDAPDFGSFLAHDYACLADLAHAVGRRVLAEEARGHAERIGAAVRQQLWWPERNFFYHRDFRGKFVDVTAVSGFMPLFAGIASPEQAAALRDHLANPATFGAPQPVPSVALDSGTFSKDMWRGPSWINLSYLCCLGLRRYGFEAEAARLKEQLLAGVQRWYEETGVLWEYYDALAVTPPGGLDRKQRLSSGKGIGPIADYHWTAAMTAAMLLED